MTDSDPWPEKHDQTTIDPAEAGGDRNVIVVHGDRPVDTKLLELQGAMLALGINPFLEPHIPARYRKKSYKYAGIGAPPMPVGPNRCSCGSGKRPKKCCQRKDKRQ